jgi:hypothetical protein
MSDTGKDIIQERQGTHGDPIDNMAAIANVWSCILNHDITAQQVAMMMSALHIIREVRGDHIGVEQLVHAEGYIEIAKRVKQQYTR